MSSNGEDAALADVTNKVSGIKVNEENVQRVKDAEWEKPQAYDYDTYNAESKAKASKDAAKDPAEGGEPTKETVWGAEAARYEWKDEYGDVGPEDPVLEKMLFRGEHEVSVGSHFSTITEMSVTMESETRIRPITKFEDAGLHPCMLRNVQLSGYQVPTPIQAYVLPAIFQGKDVIGVATTGSGKTAAFLIPTLSKLMGKAKKLAAPRPTFLVGQPFSRERGVRGEPLIVVVVPTRELAVQIFDECRRLCYRTMLRPCVAYGGAPTDVQMDEIRKGCDVLIATPGRLIDFLNRPHLLSMCRTKYTIIDEADELVGPDWGDEMSRIMGGDSNVDDDHIYMMFSATFPKGARAMAREYMSVDHVRIRVGRAGSSHVNVTQKIQWCDEPEKRQCLLDLLLSKPPARTMIFVNNKKAADFIDDFLYNNGMPSTSIHSDRTQREREDAVRAFKTGKAPIMVCTGVSARGLDIKNVMHVIQYDLPASDHGGINEYVHRIGRTARIGNTGVATAFYNEKNEDIAEALTKTLMETDQDVPDFFDQYKPQEGEALTFDDDTDEEGEEGADDAWGAEEASGTAGAADAADEGWS